MKIISHRGNLYGPNPSLENNPKYIQDAIEYGFDVEIDLWSKEDQLFLGHDFPMYPIDIKFLTDRKEKLWIHLKNLNCIDKITNLDLNFFWHDRDLTTMTSKGYFWSLPEIYLKNGITVCHTYIDVPNIYGVCTDETIKFYKNGKI